MPSDELGMDMSQMANAAEQMKDVVNADEVVEKAIESEVASPELDETVEVDNDKFWNEGEEGELDLTGEESESSEEQPAADDEEDVPQDDEAIISYKVKGKDVTLDLNELRNSSEAREQLAKDLALVGGAKQAFSKAASLQKENRKLGKKLKDADQYKAAWDKLEGIRDDEDQVFEVVTGRSLDEVVAERMERKIQYYNASEEERKILDYEDRIRRMEIQNKRDAAKRAKELAEMKELEYETDKKSVKADIHREAACYEFEGVDPAKANRLKNMLYQSAISDMKKYIKQGYKFNDKMIKKAFRDNASALEGFYKTSVDKGLKEATDKRAKVAKEKAAEVATKNYKKPSSFTDMVKKDPLSIFHAFRRGR